MEQGVIDVTAELDKEEGSAFSPDDLLFGSYNDGGIFNYDDVRIRDIQLMFARDGKANTIEKVLTLPIRQAPMVLRRERADADVHEYVNTVLFSPPHNGGMSTPLNTVVAQMCQAIVYRKTYFEKVWTERKGRVMYDKLAWRPPSTCRIIRDPKNGAFRGFKQYPIRPEGDQEEITVPPLRAFVYIHGQHRNPLEGTSDLDIAYWCFQTKQKIRFLWYSFLEGQSLPKTVVKAKTDTEAMKAAKKVIGLRQGGVIGLADNITLDVLESSGKGAAQFKEALQWLDTEASNSVLAGFTDLGASAAGGTGSFALSKDQTDFFLMSRQADSKEMSDAINSFVIPELVAINFGPDKEIPRFEFGPIAEDDAAQAIALLQAVGVTQSPVLPTEFYNELVEKVAGFLGMNTQIVREGLDRISAQATAQVAAANLGPVARVVAGPVAAVNAATKAVVGQQIRNAA